MSRGPDILLVTGEELPVPDTESPLIVAALARLGVSAQVVPWPQPARWEQSRLVLCRSTWDYFHRPHEFLDWVRRVGARVLTSQL